jgi:cholesterol oxidase
VIGGRTPLRRRGSSAGPVDSPRTGTATDVAGDATTDVTTDVVVVGSGFGGSVAALRLAEKGYRVTVVEAGQRFTAATLPRNSWDVRRYLWLPRLGCHGIQKITLLGKVLVLSGAAVGGGSVVYANTLYRPLDAFWSDPQWQRIADWRAELAPYYDQAERMLGVVRNPSVSYADEVFRGVAGEMGVEHTFALSDVGVFFGCGGAREPGVEVPDPYFGGAGPSRTGCLECGECMSGCRHNAKNTLDHNYLYLAERLRAVIVPDTRVTAVRPVAEGGYRVEGVGLRDGGRRHGWRADQVVFAAGALGTQRLLLTMREEGMLPRLSPRLGHLTRTNSEAILAAIRARPDPRLTRGVAITSSFYPNPHTHIEPVRYGRGSNLMGGLSSVLTDGGGRRPRWLSFLTVVLRAPHRALLATLPWRWSERTMIALVMQSRDSSLVVSRRRGPFGLSWMTSRQGHGEPNPIWIPEGNEAVRRIARRIGGFPGGSITEIANIPLTAHILGGAVIGTDPEDGVVDPYHRVFGHPGLHVMDGAAVPANLGVNPSLTITALAERAMAYWPNKGEPDPRPPLETRYVRMAPVPPRNPAVPAAASGAYRIGGVPVRTVDTG